MNNFFLILKQGLGKVICILCIALIVQCNQASNLRDPFSCSHAHGTLATQAQVQSHPDLQPAVQSAVADDVSSEWRVIAKKENTLIMQHRDGNIREVTLK